MVSGMSTRARRDRRDRRDLILIGLLFFLAVAGCRRRIKVEAAEIEEEERALSALITASSGLETLIEFLGFHSRSRYSYL